MVRCYEEQPQRAKHKQHTLQAVLQKQFQSGSNQLGIITGQRQVDSRVSLNFVRHESSNGISDLYDVILFRLPHDQLTRPTTIDERLPVLILERVSDRCNILKQHLTSAFRRHDDESLQLAKRIALPGKPQQQLLTGGRDFPRRDAGVLQPNGGSHIVAGRLESYAP